MKNVGIIDIGSNSIRMIVVQVHEDGSFKLIDEVKESVRLGENLMAANLLSDEKQNAALETLRFFLDLSEALSVEEIICVATEAVRRAENNNEFCRKVKEQLGLEIRILTGQEEAYYDYIGVADTMNLPDCYIMDIGGSSTELVRVSNHQLQNSVSLPFGAITISKMFSLENKVNDQLKDRMHQYLDDHFKKLDWLHESGPLIGVGGSFRNIAKIDRKLKKYPLDISHNYEMTDHTIRELYQSLGSMTKEERKKIKGLSRDRADILPGAMAEIVAMLNLTGINQLFISGSGLREGLFYDWLLKEKQTLQDVLSFSTLNVMKIYDINQIHARNVSKIALQLYEQLQEPLDIECNKDKILKTAALLHDIGINVSYYDHHKHTFYEILNCRLHGLSHKELIMVAYIAGLHRDSELDIALKYRSILSEEDLITIRKLGVLLRIAESLDRRQNGNIDRVQSAVKKDIVKMTISAKFNPGLEIKDAQSALKNFRKVFKKQFVIVQAESDRKELLT